MDHHCNSDIISFWGASPTTVVVGDIVCFDLLYHHPSSVYFVYACRPPAAQYHHFTKAQATRHYLGGCCGPEARGADACSIPLRLARAKEEAENRVIHPRSTLRRRRGLVVSEGSRSRLPQGSTVLGFRSEGPRARGTVPDMHCRGTSARQSSYTIAWCVRTSVHPTRPLENMPVCGGMKTADYVRGGEVRERGRKGGARRGKEHGSVRAVCLRGVCAIPSAPSHGSRKLVAVRTPPMKSLSPSPLALAFPIRGSSAPCIAWGTQRSQRVVPTGNSPRTA